VIYFENMAIVIGRRVAGTHLRIALFGKLVHVYYGSELVRIARAPLQPPLPAAGEENGEGGPKCGAQPTKPAALMMCRPTCAGAAKLSK
jgi:hypothetical protein